MELSFFLKNKLFSIVTSDVFVEFVESMSLNCFLFLDNTLFYAMKYPFTFFFSIVWLSGD